MFKHTLAAAAFAALSLPAFADDASMTETVVMGHLGAFGALDLEAVMADYDENSVLMLPGAELRGPDQIRPAFVALIEEFGAPGTKFELLTSSFEGPIGYITWKAETATNIYDVSTDTFLVEDGKIRIQTVTLDVSAR